MKERSIRFDDQAVRAVDDGSKTQTRAIYQILQHPDHGCEMAASELVRERQDVIDRSCPLGQPGDRLWVRETWLHVDDTGDKFDGMGSQTYWRATQNAEGLKYVEQHGLKWLHAVFMPRWASRITLEIVSVRVERLHATSEGDVIALGCPREILYGTGWYRAVWESMNGPGSWAANPWVWVVNFKKVTA